MPRRVHVYVLVVAAAALLLLPLSRRAEGAISGPPAAFATAILVVLVAGAHRRPVSVGPRRKVNVATAPEVAAVLLLPGPLAVLTLALGTLAGEARVRARPVQRLFNAAVGALRALTGSVVYAAVLPVGPDGAGGPVAAIAAAWMVYVTGTGLVLGIAAVQLWENPVRRARVSQRDLVLSEAALSLTGIMAALAAAQQVWALVLLVAPAVFAQRALREAEARYRSIFEHAVEGIFQSGFDGRFQAVNPAAARMLGYASPDQLMTEVTDLRQLYVDPARQDAFIHLMQAHGEVANFEFQARRRDGEALWISLNARAVHTADGRIRSVEGLVTDISERKRAEQERERLLERERDARAAAEAANRAKDEFLSLLSHELRTPLTPILGFTQLLLRKQPDDANLARALETIDRNARVQARLVSDLLDVSRIVTGKLQLDMDLTDLSAVISAALDAVRPAAEAKSIALTAELDAYAGAVMGDPDRLQQVVWNLLTNATKFTPEGGRVAVRLAQTGADASITVTDSGQGIAAGFLPYVFERFRQADASSTRTSGGLGLGLAIVRHLVELHGGSATASSAGEGQGATFTIRLPLAVTHQSGADGGTPDAGPTEVSPPAPLTGVHVLVVDDDADTRCLLVAVLDGAGARVTAAATSAEAQAALDAVRPDVLLTDIAMPGEDGYGLIARVRTRPVAAGGAIPALAVTAYASGEDRRRALAAGFQEHLAKPIDPAAVVAAIAHLAGRDSTASLVSAVRTPPAWR